MTASALGSRIVAAIRRRAPLLETPGLTAVRLVNGAGDGCPGLFVDRLGDVLYVQTEEPTEVRANEASEHAGAIPPLVAALAPAALFHKALRKKVRKVHARHPGELTEPEVALRHGDARAVPDEFEVLERGERFLVRPREGGHYGLFLDQRANRARLAGLVAAWPGRATLLNTFAYTCAFSVAAARAGAVTTSVDLSLRALDWGRENFRRNGLDPATHEFTRGDVLTWLAIAAKKGRRFDAVILDPPTFSTSKQSGVFQVERHFARLFALAAGVAARDGWLLCSHNLRTFDRAALAGRLREGARAAGRRITRMEPLVAPADHPGPPQQNPAARGFWVQLA